MYTFFPHNDIENLTAMVPLRIFLKEDEHDYILDGADLRWPRIAHIDCLTASEFTQGQAVIVYTSSGIPIAVGRMSSSG